MKRGKFVVLEGVSGTGKETQAKLLRTYLAGRTIRARIVYHPSPELKEILHTWRTERHITPLTEVYLLLADRSSRVSQIIAPALARGEWVISLRNYASALVYQAKNYAQRRHIAGEFRKFEPKPDVLFYFDISPQEAMNRVTARHKQTGEQLGKFETSVLIKEKRNAYRSVLKTIPHITLDASQSIQVIHKEIRKKIDVFIG